MAEHTLPTYLIDQLEALARRENRTAGELLASLLTQYIASTAAEDIPPGSLAALARSAQEADLRSETTDTSEHSREILKSEFTDYLRRRDK
jgi:hypothetical protein